MLRLRLCRLQRVLTRCLSAYTRPQRRRLAASDWELGWQSPHLACIACFALMFELLRCSYLTHRSAPGGALQRILEGPGGGVDWLRWHPRGLVLLGGSEDYSAWLWNVSDGTCMQVRSIGEPAPELLLLSENSLAGFRRAQRVSHVRVFHARRESRLHSFCRWQVSQAIIRLPRTIIVLR